MVASLPAVTAQELRKGNNGAIHKKADCGTPPLDRNRPSGGAAEWEAAVARGEAEAARQRGIFEARREEILAAHPGKHIAVCAGEVFAAGTATEVMMMAWRAHNGRASFFYSPGHVMRGRVVEDGTRAAGRGSRATQAPEPTPEEAERVREWEAAVARGEAEAARQRGIFEARREEILAAHPGKHIAVCAGEVFAADTRTGAAQMAWRAHNGRASFFYSPGHVILDL